jgi:hypothetical protein
MRPGDAGYESGVSGLVNDEETSTSSKPHRGGIHDERA